MTKHCPTCHIPTNSIKAVIRKNAILTGCDGCINTLKHGTDLAAKNHRQADYRERAEALVQPFENAYAKLYGEENARLHGWDDEALRKYG